jgi:hypothetical protein
MYSLKLPFYCSPFNTHTACGSCFWSRRQFFSETPVEILCSSGSPGRFCSFFGAAAEVYFCTRWRPVAAFTWLETSSVRVGKIMQTSASGGIHICGDLGGRSPHIYLLMQMDRDKNHFFQKCKLIHKACNLCHTLLRMALKKSQKKTTKS